MKNPTRRRARKLIKKMAEKGEETRDAPQLQPAKEFLNSIWQGKAIAKPVGGFHTFDNSETSQSSDDADPDPDTES